MEELNSKLPMVQQWIDALVSQHAPHAKAVNQLGFSRLPNYFSSETLNTAKCIFTDKIPMPPLSKLGLKGFENFEKMNFDGITFKNLYFARSKSKENESLHFHELVHVIQWDHLGAEKFLKQYASEILTSGYDDSQLERMAYRHQGKFDKKIFYDAEKQVRLELDSLRK